MIFTFTSRTRVALTFWSLVQVVSIRISCSHVTFGTSEKKLIIFHPNMGFGFVHLCEWHHHSTVHPGSRLKTSLFFPSIICWLFEFPLLGPQGCVSSLSSSLFSFPSPGSGVASSLVDNYNCSLRSPGPSPLGLSHFTEWSINRVLVLSCPHTGCHSHYLAEVGINSPVLALLALDAVQPTLPACLLFLLCVHCVPALLGCLFIVSWMSLHPGWACFLQIPVTFNIFLSYV